MTSSLPAAKLVRVSGTPTNYTPTGPTVQGHLEGVDNALASAGGGTVYGLPVITTLAEWQALFGAGPTYTVNQSVSVQPAGGTIVFPVGHRIAEVVDGVVLDGMDRRYSALQFDVNGAAISTPSGSNSERRTIKNLTIENLETAAFSSVINSGGPLTVQDCTILANEIGIFCQLTGANETRVIGCELIGASSGTIPIRINPNALGVRFTDCEIYGGSSLLSADTLFRGCDFYKTDSAAWLVQTGSSGAPAVVTVFRDCNFSVATGGSGSGYVRAQNFQTDRSFGFEGCSFSGLGIAIQCSSVGEGFRIRDCEFSTTVGLDVTGNGSRDLVMVDACRSSGTLIRTLASGDRWQITGNTAATVIDASTGLLTNARIVGNLGTTTISTAAFSLVGFPGGVARANTSGASTIADFG